MDKKHLDLIESFFRDSLGLSEQEILSRLSSLAPSFSGKIQFLFGQLEQDIETTLRIPREYLAQKVLNKDISDVPLENLEKVLPLVNSKKREISNSYYQYLFESFNKNELSRKERLLVKEAQDRLKLFLEFQNTIRDVVAFHIEVKKLFSF